MHNKGNEPMVTPAAASPAEESGPTKAWPLQNSAAPTLNISRWLNAVYNNWTFGYMSPILRKGRQQFKSGEHLVQEDLYEVPDYMRAEVLAATLWRHYNENKSLPRTFLRLAAPSFVPAGYWEFIYMLCRLALPISLRYLLVVLEENAGDGSAVLRKGMPFAICLSVAAFLAALSQNQTTFLSNQSGIMLRGALTTAIYEHALRLTPVGRMGLTTGEVTNLVAVDTQKLYDVMLEGHLIWSCPVLICMVTVLLWTFVGPELTIGVAMLILVVPVVQQIVEKMLRIRKERSKLTDQRINILTSMLQGMRVTKLNHYESKVEENVMNVRNQEMELLRRELRMWGYVLSAAVISPLLAFGVAFACYVLVDGDNIITPSEAFTTLLLFSILRFPINMTARLVGKLAQASEAVRRISDFLKREVRPLVEEKPFQDTDSDGESVPVVDLKNGSFSLSAESDLLWLESRVASTSPNDLSDVALAVESAQVVRSAPPFVLRNFSLQVKKSQVVAVVGSVGAGKSLFLRALLGEVPCLPTTEQSSLQGTVSYSAQQPFIINASLRANILFGSAMDECRYEHTIDACCLRPDINRLGRAGDCTEIGERGVTLSGGQKARVALARSLYAKSDVALLDDVFSALDSNTASSVFEGLFGSESECTGMLRSSGTVLVTHAVQFLPRVDLIMVIVDGSPTFCGTWSEMQQIEGVTKDIINAVVYSTDTDGDEKRQREGARQSHDRITEKDGIFMTTEEREYGVASLSVWTTWFHHAGGWSFFLWQLLFLIVDRGLYVGSDWWISFWSQHAFEGGHIFGVYFPPQTDGRSAQVQYLTVYAVILVLSTLATIVRSLWSVAGGARCANIMFKHMTARVLRAPMSYFETTPLGRVLNRFTHDVEVLDIELSVSMTGLMISFSWLVSSVVVMVAVLPWILLAIMPVSVVYFNIQLYYRMSGPDLQRLDAMSRSPIQANLAEGLEGSATIRAFRKEKVFGKIFAGNVDRNCGAMLNFIAAQRWLGLRIELLGATISLAVTLIVVCASESLQIPVGLVGLLILWAVIFSAALNFFFLRLTESEARITSIERIQRTTALPQEAAWETDDSIHLDPSWPAKGELEFDNVCMRYRSGLPLALDSVSFRLAPGTRCGIVGRSGSGKTSLTASLFRLVEIESGRIVLDGVDLSKLGLSDVRGRPSGLRVIPQDPVLFAGTIRGCIDPLHNESDAKVLEALHAVNHRGARDRGMDVLDDIVGEGGETFSAGERQLLCLARAILEEPRVLVLDEATASVDLTTDGLIQTMLRTRFKQTTMLTIAHRIDTIVHYDVVLVMHDGKVVEFGAPRDLLDNADSAFSGLVNATGAESAAELRRIARVS